MKDQVLDFFSNKINKEVSEETIINKIDFFGIDAVVIMSEFFDKFLIDNSEDFEIFSFFVSELSFIDFLKKNLKERMKNKKDLKISHLIKVAEKQKWFEPNKNDLF